MLFFVSAYFNIALPVFLYCTFRYEVTRSGGGVAQTVSHGTNPSSNRVTTTWTGLIQWTTYTFTVQCKIQGEACQGNALTFSATTTGWCMYPFRLFRLDYKTCRNKSLIWHGFCKCVYKGFASLCKQQIGVEICV